MTSIGTTTSLTEEAPVSFDTLADFRSWVHSADQAERGRFTYINGGFEIDLSPERISGHNEIKSELYATLGLIVRQRQLGKVFPDGALLVNDDANLGCEPDMMFCSWETLRSRRVTFRAWKRDDDGDVELFGSPDLVVEVISNSSWRKDTVELRQAYFTAGIREYWLIDGRSDDITFEVLVRGESEFIPVPPSANGFRKPSTFGASFRLSAKPTRLAACSVGYCISQKFNRKISLPHWSSST